ncbi:hypothetical protein H072_9454 [Dactylellina haptotyla CBS 200.50]|uniref:Peptidase S8/S53 domain-containing protein n=1 Tax=Dactylellina haptotyla (strain CBS 200.50) TaxID=1284197 RepID=S8A2N3_DACHA|nr:hypothetical protein H072_9454 [Dactylellina haptotyla CBS 200.50]
MSNFAVFLRTSFILNLLLSRVFASTKIGTWERGFLSYWFIIDFANQNSAEENQNILDRFKTEIRKFLLPPKDEAIYIIQSETLGLVTVVADTPGNIDNEEGIRAACIKFPELKEFRNTHFRDWIFVGPSVLEEPRDDPFSFDFNKDEKGQKLSHGTSVTSKIVGENLGFAQKSEVVVVNIARGDSRGSDNVGNKQYLFLDGLVKVHDYVKKHGLSGQCVINMSLEFWMPALDLLESYDGFGAIYGPLIKFLLNNITDKLNCYVVVAAGNGEPSEPITANPPSFGGELNPKKFVVVAGHETESEQNYYQIADFVRISAPAEDIKCAKGYLVTEKHKNTYATVGGEFNTLSGTSFATPVVSALNASFISIGYSDPVDHLYAISETPLSGVVPGAPRLAFIGINTDQWPIEFRP